MKNPRNTLVAVFVLFGFIHSGITADSDTERQERILNYKYNSGAEGLNIEHIISMWNRSSDASEKPPISQRWSMPNDRQETNRNPVYRNSQTSATVLPPSTKKPFQPTFKMPESFPERFKMCVGQQQKQYRLAEASPNQNIIIKCFKTELISKLQRLLIDHDSSIKLFNGYLEFEKIRTYGDIVDASNATKKRYSSRVAAKKTPDFPTTSKPENLVSVPLKQSKANLNHRNEYYENYQKMLKELVSRKSGEHSKRVKRDTKEEESNSETLQKTANLFESGRQLFSEITSRLENEEEDVESLTQTILDPELVSTLNTFSRSYAVKLNFYPGISARMKRNQNSGVTFDLELDELSGDDDDEEEEEEDDSAARGDKKKKKKKKIKISKKTLKKLFPYLLIPFMIQAALLPFVLKFLLFVAIKALIAGKLALVLVAFNVLKNSSHKSDEDEYAERMAVEHYGYGNGEEYGAWINRRNIEVPENDGRDLDNGPYRAHNPIRQGRQTE